MKQGGIQLKKILFIILFTFSLAACTPFKTSSMPEQMTDDFGFSIQYGGDQKNEIDTFKGLVVKDLVENGTAEANITFSDKEMSEIYEKMKDINVLEKKKFNSKCESEPYEETEWKIIIDSEIVTHSIREYCDPTSDAEQFLALRNYIFDKIKVKEEYIKLPESEGGYD